MFDNLKFEWFHDGDAPMISWDLREGEIETVIAGIKASDGKLRYTHFFDETVEDELAGDFYIDGVRHVVYTQQIGDTFNATTARRWTFTLEEAVYSEDQKMILSDIRLKGGDFDVSSFWIDCLPLMRALKPFMSDAPVIRFDAMLDTHPVTPDEIEAVFTERETAWKDHRIVMGDGIGTWAWACKDSVSDQVREPKSRAERALHILEKYERPASVTKVSFCRDLQDA